MRRLVLPAISLAGFAALGEYLCRRDPARFDPVVECKQGHRFRTIWVPGGSLKALRAFNRRYQWRPIGHHWSWMRCIDSNRLTADECQAAYAIHDLRVA